MGIKINRTLPSGSSSYITLRAKIDVTSYRGKTATFSADVENTTNTAISIQLANQNNNLKYTTIPYNTPITTYSVSYTIEEDATTLDCILALNPNVNHEYVYTDNWTLKIQ